MDDILRVVSFVLPFRLSFVSVVFDFNASLNDVAPVSLILLPVDLMRIRMCYFLISFMCCFFRRHHTN